MNGGLWILALAALFLIVRLGLEDPSVTWEDTEELDALERIYDDPRAARRPLRGEK